MGQVTREMLEMLTDRHASRIQAVIDGLINGVTSNTEEGLAAYIDLYSSDPLLQGALLTSAADVDRQAIGGDDFRASLNEIIDWTSNKALYTALRTFVTGEDGGDNASFAAYVNSIGIKIHPLAVEAIRKALGEGAFTLSGSIVGAAPPKQLARAFDRVWAGAEGSLSDVTTAAGETTDNDVVPWASNGNCLYLGSRFKFGYILSSTSTVGSATITPTVKYWNGTEWTAVSGLTDNTTGFSVDGGLISFTIPDDWVPHNKDNQATPEVFGDSNEEELYYLRIERTNSGGIDDPELEWLLHVPEAIQTASNALYGYDQPPLGIVRITGSATISATEIQDPDRTRFELPYTSNNELRLRAITDISGTVVFTLGYKDQDDNAATKAQTSWSSPSAGDTKALVLADGDTGLREFTASTCTKTGTATSGVFVIEVGDYPRTPNVK